MNRQGFVNLYISCVPDIYISNSYSTKRRHDSSSEESDAEELDSFYNDPIDLSDTYSSDEQGEKDPLGDELDSDFDDDPLGDNENCVLNFEFDDPLEAEEYNFDESDDGECIYEEFGSEVESDTEADTEDSDSDDPVENEAAGSKSKPMFCIVIFSVKL